MLQTEETFVPGQTADRQLKPSEAMRLGAKLRPQCQRRFYRDGASCARTDPAARQIETASNATLNLRRERPAIGIILFSPCTRGGLRRAFPRVRA